MLSALSSPVFSHIQPFPQYGASQKETGANENQESDTKGAVGKSGEKLSREDQQSVDQLKKTDREVRAHEAAHVAAGGNLVTSGASFTFETGPDGKQYAVAGEVGISTAKGRTPEETLARAQQIRAAALAPADPSSQDRAVAASASQMAAEARAELSQAEMEKNTANTSQSGDAGRGQSFGQAIANSIEPHSHAVSIYA